MDSNWSQEVINPGLARNTQVKSLRLRNFRCRWVLSDSVVVFILVSPVTGLRS